MEKKRDLTDQDDRDLEDLEETYWDTIKDYLEAACAALKKNKSINITYVQHEIFIATDDHFYVRFWFLVDHVEDKIDIDFDYIDDFNSYKDLPVSDKVVLFDVKTGIAKCGRPTWDKSRIILRLAYKLWEEIRCWL